MIFLILVLNTQISYNNNDDKFEDGTYFFMKYK